MVGILKGGKPGGCVALRADMDALPVEEKVDLPFASKVKAPWMGGMTGVGYADLVAAVANAGALGFLSPISHFCTVDTLVLR